MRASRPLRLNCNVWVDREVLKAPRPPSPQDLLSQLLIQPSYFNLTAEPACLPCWHRQAEDAEDGEIFPLDSGTTGLETRNSFSRARTREGPIPHGFAFSAISAVKNPGPGERLRVAPQVRPVLRDDHSTLPDPLERCRLASSPVNARNFTAKAAKAAKSRHFSYFQRSPRAEIFWSASTSRSGSAL